MEYFSHLQKDRKLRKVLLSPLPPLKLQPRADIRLMQSIMSQQLSTTVARTLHQRFFAHCGSDKPDIRFIAQMDPALLQAIGLSRAKTSYILNVAQFFTQHSITDRKLRAMPSEQIITLLTQIKGVGRWTVEMLLMFTLAREDVFAVDDLGIQLAMTQLYRLERPLKGNRQDFKNQLLSISERWSPYKTYACLHLWRFKDNPPL
ncbi:DNA-3-methyladenine glycosylase II [Arachidicoccus rhizosphaerae]|uniref:DNA-3-methyladenine glycosylase II n=1 Tax=Arachidicoccus rhizosphaerae TaxID=551991 RepID=A0A1H4B3C5_9BACT|nr:DNA-3-methyladenine glycosylase [Arachidicoccus rhizosphaerae]SEA42402.1 DNA-3-methyladenine glycosylase II [Arachidicoccus rhizosphaerae]